MGITNDFDMTHVARHANYQGSLTTPVPQLLTCAERMPSILRRTHLPVQVQRQEEHLVLKHPWQVKTKELGEPVGALHGLKGKALAEPKGFIEAPQSQTLKLQQIQGWDAPPDRMLRSMFSIITRKDWHRFMAAQKSQTFNHCW